MHCLNADIGQVFHLRHGRNGDSEKRAITCVTERLVANLLFLPVRRQRPRDALLIPFHGLPIGQCCRLRSGRVRLLNGIVSDFCGVARSRGRIRIRRTGFLELVSQIKGRDHQHECDDQGNMFHQVTNYSEVERQRPFTLTGRRCQIVFVGLALVQFLSYLISTAALARREKQH